MRFNRLDLNLLVALDVLLSERSITRAAQRMNLTPSAMSSALSRLREYFDDELLAQVGRRMELTPRAAGLHDAVRDVLVRIDSTIAIQPEFNPATSDRTFRIFLSDYTQLVFAPHVLALATQEQCTARFELLPQVSNPQHSLERGEADLLIIPRGFLSPDHPEEVLYEEHFVCVVWRHARLANADMTIDRYLAAGHVAMQPPGGPTESFEAWLMKRQDVSRRIAVTTFGFAPLAALVCGTEYVATIHARLAAVMATAWPVVIKRLPMAIGHMEQAVQWHKYRTQDPGLAWLRGLLRRAVDRMDASNGSESDAASALPEAVTALPTGKAR